MVPPGTSPDPPPPPAAERRCASHTFTSHPYLWLLSMGAVARVVGSCAARTCFVLSRFSICHDVYSAALDATVSRGTGERNPAGENAPWAVVYDDPGSTPFVTPAVRDVGGRKRESSSLSSDARVSFASRVCTGTREAWAPNWGRRRQCVGVDSPLRMLKDFSPTPLFVNSPARGNREGSCRETAAAVDARRPGISGSSGCCRMLVLPTPENCRCGDGERSGWRGRERVVLKGHSGSVTDRWVWVEASDAG